MFDRVRERHHRASTDPIDLENPFDFDFMLEVKMQVGEQVAEERVGRQTIGERLGVPATATCDRGA